MNLLETMSSENEQQTNPTENLQHTIAKYKKLLREQSKTLSLKDSQIKSLKEQLTRLKDEMENQEYWIDQYKSDLKSTAKKLENEIKDSRHLSCRLRDVEEDLAKERSKTPWEKFKEQYRFFTRKKYKMPQYHNVEWYKTDAFFMFCCGVIGIILFLWIMKISIHAIWF